MREGGEAEVRGFTLLELVVAMALSALVVLSAGVALKFAIDVWWRGGGPEEEVITLFRAMEFMGRQLRYTSGIRPPFRKGKGFFTCTEAEVTFLTNRAPFSARGGPVLVSYTFDGESLLYREVPYTAPRDEGEALSMLQEVEPIRLLEAVEGRFTCQFPEGGTDSYFPDVVEAEVRFKDEDYKFVMPVEVVP